MASIIRILVIIFFGVVSPAFSQGPSNDVLKSAVKLRVAIQNGVNFDDFRQAANEMQVAAELYIIQDNAKQSSRKRSLEKLNTILGAIMDVWEVRRTQTLRSSSSLNHVFLDPNVGPPDFKSEDIKAISAIRIMAPEVLTPLAEGGFVRPLGDKVVKCQLCDQLVVFIPDVMPKLLSKVEVAATATITEFSK